MERSGELEGSGTALGCGDVPRPGALSGSGVSPEVGERRGAAAGAEGAEVTSLGAVGGGVGESPETQTEEDARAPSFAAVLVTAARTWKQPRCHRQIDGYRNDGTRIQCNTTQP